MSQGRIAIQQTQDDGRDAAASLLFRFIAQGRSFSGREHNCCFLNTGGPRFADVSAAVGWDFTDDGRAVAVVDWDLDGDLDFWLVNRSGPQLRFLRNGTPSDNHFVAFRLEGRSCNRDAVGARLELTVSGQSNPHIKTLRAGEGFLAQSSKWVHFGLGSRAELDQLTVHWPGGTAESFSLVGKAANHRYRIVQGSASAETWSLPSRTVHLNPSRLEPSTQTERIHVVSASRVPLPTLPYTDLTGQSVDVQESNDGPVLLNLWASWCQPCQVELAELSKHWPQLHESGLKIVALSVDSLDEVQGSQAIDKFILSADLPFTVGTAEPGLVEKLQLVHNHLFGWHRQLPIPTSVLVDSAGRLAAIYKGPIEIEKLRQDVQNASSLDGDALRERSLPLAGRWLHAYSPRAVTPMVFQLAVS